MDKHLAGFVATALESAAGLPLDSLVAGLNYDLETLRITVEFEDVPSIHVDFDQPLGFRVLDEGDLLEFWNPETRPVGWLWLIERGGWHDLEKSRDGFLSHGDTRLSEYLVAGCNECVSVLAFEGPRVVPV